MIVAIYKAVKVTEKQALACIAPVYGVKQERNVIQMDPSRTFPRWKFPAWQPQFQDAILEFDARKLPPLVEAATASILLRLQSQEANPEELRALANALRSIRAIQTKRLNHRAARNTLQVNTAHG